MDDHAVGLTSVLEAAVHDRIGTLCRRAYAHELRGGLQAIRNSMELMARATAETSPSMAGPSITASLANKASDLSKRALATHEREIARVIDELLVQPQEAQRMDLGALAGDCVQFLQIPAAERGVGLLWEAEEGLLIHARKYRLRTSILGVILSAMHHMPDGSQLCLTVRRRDGGVLLRFAGPAFDARRAVPEPAALASADLDELIFPVVRQVLVSEGGRVSTDADDEDGLGTLSIAFAAA